MSDEGLDILYLLLAMLIWFRLKRGLAWSGREEV